MKRLLVFAVAFLCLLVLQAHASSDGTDRKNASAQFIYMDLLRKGLNTGGEADDREPSSRAPGTLLATSFNDSNANVRRFDVSSDNGDATLHFVVPQQKDNSDIVSSELWLFPSLEAPQGNEWYNLWFLIEPTLLDPDTMAPQFNRAFKSVTVEVDWKSTDRCLMLDTTALTKRIARKIKNNAMNKTLVVLDVTMSLKMPILEARPSNKEAEWQRTCKVLTPSTSNSSFLVIKYYSDHNTTTTTTERRKRSSRAEEGDTDGPCSLVPFYVNLPEVYGSWILSPTEPVDIQDCSGTCDIVSNYGLFSARSVLISRLRESSKYNRQVSCVPTAFEPMVLLIDQEDYYVLVKYAIKATKCGCR